MVIVLLPKFKFMGLKFGAFLKKEQEQTDSAEKLKIKAFEGHLVEQGQVGQPPPLKSVKLIYSSIIKTFIYTQDKRVFQNFFVSRCEAPQPNPMFKISGPQAHLPKILWSPYLRLQGQGPAKLGEKIENNLLSAIDY